MTESTNKMAKKVSIPNHEKRSSSVINAEDRVNKAKQGSSNVRSILAAEIKAKKSQTKVTESVISRDAKKNKLRHGSQSASNGMSRSKDEQKSISYKRKSSSKNQANIGK